jgi:hypothetical protein
MRFGFAGDLAESVHLLKAIAESQSHELVRGYFAEPLLARLVDSELAVERASSAEDVLLAEDVDAVVVATASSDESIHLVRQASQADKHVIVLPADSPTVAYSFELHLILDESRRGILPLGGRWYGDEFSSDDAPDLKRISLAGRLHSSKSEFQRSQLYAIDSLYGLGIPYTRVTTLDTTAPDGQLISRTITLGASGENDAAVPPATLTISEDSSPEDCSRIRLSAADGVSTDVACNCPVQNLTAGASTVPIDLERVVSALADSNICQHQMAEFSNTLETLSAVERSVQRRRTIDIHFDGISERSVFKSQMTAIGCGVLTYVMFGMVAYLILAQMADLPPWALNTARAIWIAPVVIYLLAQALLPIARERSGNR